MIENLAWCRTGIKATKTYRVYSNAFMEGRPQGETGPRNYLRPGIPSIQSGPGAPLSSHIPDRRVSLHTHRSCEHSNVADEKSSWVQPSLDRCQTLVPLEAGPCCSYPLQQAKPPH